jgi:ABC-type spermidine/putrescine transport system permease subunit I
MPVTFSRTCARPGRSPSLKSAVTTPGSVAASVAKTIANGASPRATILTASNGFSARAIFAGPRTERMNVLAAFSPEEITAILLSLKVAFWAMTASLPVGILVALLLARGRFWGKSLLNGVVHLPLIMPPVVTGYILLLLFGRRGPLGQLLDQRGMAQREPEMPPAQKPHPPILLGGNGRLLLALAAREASSGGRVTSLR